MPVPNQVRDDGSGIQNIMKSLDSGLRQNDALKVFGLFTRLSNLSKDYLAIRTKCKGVCGKVFQAIGVAVPPTIREE